MKRRSVVTVYLLATTIAVGSVVYLAYRYRKRINPAPATEAYADPKSCTQCHAAEAAGYATTGMAQAKGEELDRSTSDVSTLISPQEVQNIPLQQRATENLLAFIPGVVHGGAGDQPSTSQLSINGSRTLNTEVLLNGVSTIVASTGTPATLPSPDGVDSFRVLTNNAPAEYGRTSGAVISVNSISGTNTFHGNLYFLLRNEALDANKYFNKETINAP